MFAASAIAGNTFMRSLAGAGFPLFAIQMYDGLGIQWTGTLLGCVAAVMAPIPFVFYFYGEKIRRRSSFAPTMPPPPFTAEDVDESSNGETMTEKEGNEAAQMAATPRRLDDLEANGSR